MINSVVLVGRLTKQVDLRYTQSGTAVANFTVAVDRNYRNAQGEIQTDFINCVMWRRNAENFAKFTRKGSLVGIEGSIQTRNYENSQGQRVYVTEVLANNFSLLEPKSVTDQRSNEDTNEYRNDSANNNSYDFSNNSSDTVPESNGDPFAGMNNSNPFPSSDSDDKINISDDDLPF